MWMITFHHSASEILHLHICNAIHSYLSSLLVRKLFSILLLACLCFSLIGYHLFFQFQIEKAKSEMFAFLKNQKHHKGVIEFCFKGADEGRLDWENDHEFRYQNKMYDVIEKNTDGKGLSILCIADDHETELVNEYQKSNKQNRSGDSVIELITASFILPKSFSADRSEKELNNQYFNYSSSLDNISSSVAVPPPDFVGFL